MTTTTSSLNKTPSGRIARRSPEVQELQSAPTYIDIYTGSPLSQNLRWRTHESSSLPHAHPDSPARWRGPRGFGARHINDCVPFSLWSEDREDFRVATVDEMRYITEAYNAERLEFRDWLIVIETRNPTKPVPLTVAGMPATFVPPGHKRRYMFGLSPYVGPRIRDPCPHLAWKRMEKSLKSQMIEVISVLTDLMNIQRVNFFPTSIVVELVPGDGRVYSRASLPAVVAGLSTTYHHDSVSFFSPIKDHTRDRLLDPSQYLPGPRLGPLPQDGTNYLREPFWGVLSPGVRLSAGSTTISGTYTDTVRSTTCGILLRKAGNKVVTTANHGFLEEDEVFHPGYDGDKIGDVVDRYPELDVAMVQLTPANAARFSNETYFQAEPPKRLAERSDLVPGTWFEVDGMSSGLLSLLYISDSFEKPVSPPGHPDIPVLRWKHNTVCEIFGATNSELTDGICGAPLVETQTGNVAGFFHMANGDYAECAALDDLVAEGWEVA